MAEPVLLPQGVSVGILAFLLSLLPAGLFLWVWYLRRHDRAIPASVVAIGFIGGLVIVPLAFVLESVAPRIWETVSPGTVHYFEGAILPLYSLSDLLFPAIGTFLIVALIEEGLRYLFLLGVLRFNRRIDQVFDGLVVGLAAGLGFATLENTIYFFDLFSAGNFDTLVFVFFLRFLVSTLAHISFGGIMGALMAQGFFSIYRRRIFLVQAFFVTWFLHGLYDWLLGVNQTVYAVLLLVGPLLVLILWSNRAEFFAINRDTSGRLLASQQAPPRAQGMTATSTVGSWNENAPWLNLRRAIKPTPRKSPL